MSAPLRLGCLEASWKSIPGNVHPYEDRVLVEKKRGLFAVADGVTGSSQGSGGIAAELALELLRKYFEGDLLNAIERVHHTIVEKRVSDRSIGETTMTALAVVGNSLEACNLGDSPAYLVRDRTMRSLITEDVTPSGRITQVIGYPEVVHIHSVKMQPRTGDLLIISSDGVEHVLQPSFVDTLVSETSIHRIAESIVEQACLVATGYDDDKSVIVLRMG